MRAKHFRSVVTAVALAVPVLSASARAGEASGADIYVYPTSGQSERKLDRDRYECHGWASKQTGYDPSQPDGRCGCGGGPGRGHR